MGVMKTAKKKGRGGKAFLELRDGACSVKIYSGEQKKGDVKYPIHFLTYMEGGARVRKGFSDLAIAKAEAGVVLTRLVNGETKAAGVTAVDIQTAALAARELDGLGVHLLTAVKEYRQALAALNGKGSVNEAVAYFLKHARPDLPRKTVLELVVEFLAAKNADKKSAFYLKDLKQRLKIFGQHFSGPIVDVTTQEMENWLRGMSVSPKHRNNYANTVTTLFNFAKRAGYLPKDQVTAAENLSRAKNVDGAIVIYTPDELGRMLRRLATFRPELLPYVAIGAFAGARPAEICRLAWADVDLEGRFITIGAGQSKTSKRRLIPIQPCLAAWLMPFAKKEGLIVSNVKIQAMVRKLIEGSMTNEQGQREPGVTWKQNALRHSYGSYRLPVLKSAAELALEMGNSAPMIFRHYREIVKPAVADEFWAIMPPHGYAENLKKALAKNEAAAAVTA